MYQAEAGRAVETLRAFAGTSRDQMLKAAAESHAAETAAAAAYFGPRIAGTEKQLKIKLADIDKQAAADQANLTAGRERDIAADQARHAAELTAATGRADAELTAAEARFTTRTGAAAAARSHAWESLAADWHAGLAAVAAENHALAAAGAAHFPVWAELPGRPLADSVPEGVRFGSLAVDLAKLPDGVPADPRLAPREAVAADVPAFAPFPERAAVLVKAADADRVAAVGVLQAVMLRYLTALPPGKVRFTVIDPVGLGENFAAFMHLADFDEKLVGGRIWTEPAQIGSRLTDLTEHMETVIQKYLRNQYKSIEDYNRAAGEVAEPYRVLVVADFPTNFTADAARRLVSIMASGPACGVCTLVGVDTLAPLPRDFRLADLEQQAFSLSIAGGTATVADAAYAPFPVTLDPAPPPAAVADAVRRVGRASVAAARVEVPFEYIMPAAGTEWTASAAKGFDIPIGRAGATRRRNFLVGKGTAQHALVAGKTGSGKSTLLHALITNLSLMYSPDRVAELLPDRLQEGGRVQDLRRRTSCRTRASSPIESDREFGAQRARNDWTAILQANGATCSGRHRRATTWQRLPRPPRRARMRPMPAHPAGRRRIPRVLRRGRQASHRPRQACCSTGSSGKGRAFGIHVLLGIANARRSVLVGPQRRSARWRCGSRCSAARADAHLILSARTTPPRGC